MISGIFIREAIAAAARAVRRDGIRGIAERASAHMAEARECRRFLRSLERNPPSGPEEAVAAAFSSESIRPFQIQSEILGLARRVAALKPRTILEIGTARGGTLFTWTRCAAPDALLISLDLHGGKWGGGYSAWRGDIYRKFAMPGQTLHLVRGNSHETITLEQVRGLLSGALLDFLFIDGDHSYEGVKQDFQLYGPLVRPGGLAAFHDVVPNPANAGGEVYRFWAELRAEASFLTEEIIENPTQERMGIGVIRA